MKRQITMCLFMSIFILKSFNNIAFSSLFTKLLSLTQIDGHERSSINNVELLGTIWEHKKKKRGERGKLYFTFGTLPFRQGHNTHETKIKDTTIGWYINCFHIDKSKLNMFILCNFANSLFKYIHFYEFLACVLWDPPCMDHFNYDTQFESGRTK